MSLVSAALFFKNLRLRQAADRNYMNQNKVPLHAAVELIEDAENMTIDEESVIKYSMNPSCSDQCMKNMLVWRSSKS